MSREINMRRAKDYHMNRALFIYQRKINTHTYFSLLQICKLFYYYTSKLLFSIKQEWREFFRAHVRLYFIIEIIILDNSNRSCDIKELFVQTISSLSKWKRSKRTRPRICGTFPTAIFSPAKWFYSKLYNTVSYI